MNDETTPSTKLDEFETREVEALERIAKATERIARALEKSVFGTVLEDN